MRACWLKWVGRDWSISADYIWLNYSGANNAGAGRPRASKAMLGGDAEALLDAYSLEDVPIGRLDLTPSLIERARAERRVAPLA